MRKDQIKRITAGGLLVMAAAVMPVTNAYAYTGDDTEAVVPEKKEEAKPFSIAGNGEVLDDVTDDDTKQFITITTKNNQTFFVVIDRASSSDNVYMLSMIDEDDLSGFLENGGETGLALPNLTADSTEQAKHAQTPDISTTDEPIEPIGMNPVAYIVMIAVVLAVTLAAGYYIKIYKPRKEAAEDQDEGLEEDYDYDDDDEPEEEEDVSDDDIDEAEEEDTENEDETMDDDYGDSGDQDDEEEDQEADTEDSGEIAEDDVYEIDEDEPELESEISDETLDHDKESENNSDNRQFDQKRPGRTRKRSRHRSR